MAEENVSIATQVQEEPKIDFFGFTGENTIGDVKLFFLEHSDDVIYVFDNMKYARSWDNIIVMFLNHFFGDDEGFKRKYMNTEFYKRYKTYSNRPSIKDFTVEENITLLYIYENCTFDNTYYGYGNANNTEKDFKIFLKASYSRKQIIKVTESNNPDFLNQIHISDEEKEKLDIKEYTNKEEITDTEELDMIGEKIDKAIDEGRKQIVLTGAPGTGKTYGVREYIARKVISILENNKNPTEKGKKILGEIKGKSEKEKKEKMLEWLEKTHHYCFVQFHASYNYTDFVEGLKPATLNGEHTFVRVDGIFKKFCRRAEERIIEEIIKNYKEEHSSKKEKEATEETAEETTEVTAENITITAEMRKKAINKLVPYYFVIDEINRADLSSVFGELMFCLEETYRSPTGTVKTQYHDLPTYEYISEDERQKVDYAAEIQIIVEDGTISQKTKIEKLIETFNSRGSDNVTLLENDVFENGFFIPENVIIIGTMNDIDRNVETFDFALRRRFRWIDIDADKSLAILDTVLADKGVYIKTLKERAEALNEVIAKDTYHLGEAFKLGQAYFAKFTDKSTYVIYFVNELEPILREYMRGKKNVDEFIYDCGDIFTDGQYRQYIDNNKG